MRKVSGGGRGDAVQARQSRLLGYSEPTFGGRLRLPMPFEKLLSTLTTGFGILLSRRNDTWCVSFRTLHKLTGSSPCLAARARADGPGSAASATPERGACWHLARKEGIVSRRRGADARSTGQCIDIEDPHPPSGQENGASLLFSLEHLVGGRSRGCGEARQIGLRDGNGALLMHRAELDQRPEDPELCRCGHQLDESPLGFVTLVNRRPDQGCGEIRPSDEHLLNYRLGNHQCLSRSHGQNGGSSPVVGREEAELSEDVGAFQDRQRHRTAASHLAPNSEPPAVDDMETVGDVAFVEDDLTLPERPPAGRQSA
jgi:hypothetical protein